MNNYLPSKEVRHSNSNSNSSYTAANEKLRQTHDATKTSDSCPSKVDSEMLPSCFGFQPQQLLPPSSSRLTYLRTDYSSYYSSILRKTVMFYFGFALQHQSNNITHFSDVSDAVRRRVTRNCLGHRRFLNVRAL